MRIATWNINSVRLRIAHVLRFIKEQNIDVMCLQETKSPDEFFPLNDFRDIGLEYYHFRGEKSYNGVAVLSKIPISDNNHIDWCGLNDKRHISVILKNKITLHNFYVPAGGDVPDQKTNSKFKHKIQFVNEMINHFKMDKTQNRILVGDLNIAPYENDVWSHKQLLNVVSHTPIETDNLKKLLNDGKWVDIMREFVPLEEKLYSWWSYRNRDWKVSNRGRRLDHIWLSDSLVSSAKKLDVYKETRDWEKPSDHVPVVLEIEI